MQYGAKMHATDGEEISPGRLLVEWDPYTRAILTETGGVVDLHDHRAGRKAMVIFHRSADW